MAETSQKIFAQDLENLKQFRKQIVEMVHYAKEGHIPSAFSILEIVYVLYKYCLNYDPKNSKSKDRDYFMLSKGHAGAALYTVLAHFNFFDKEKLRDYCQPTSIFGGHPDAVKVPGVEVSSGSLGHGIAMAVGTAYALRLQNSPRKVVALVGDGEMEEGSFWESIMLAKNLGLNNLVVIADANGSQKYSHKFDYRKVLETFDWNAVTVPGHDLGELSEVLVPLVKKEQTNCSFVLAQTTKGFGVERFVGEHAWHRRTPTADELKEISEELT